MYEKTVLLFTLNNISIDHDGKQENVINPSEKLYIQGLADETAPATVFLHVSHESVMQDIS